MIAALLFYGTVGAAGAGVAALLFSGRRGWIEFVATAWLLGCAVVSLALIVFGQLFGPAWGVFGVLCTTLLLGGLGWRQMRENRLTLVRPTISDWPTRLLLVGITAMTLLYFWWFSRQCLGWDGLLIWEFKAGIIFVNGGTLPLDYYQSTTAEWSHRGYPLFLPNLEAWYYLIAGERNQPAVKWVLAPFYPVLLYFVYSATIAAGANRKTGLVAALLFPMMEAPILGIGSLGSGYCDVPVAIAYVAAVAALLRADLPLFAVLAGTLPWMKRDGTILWGLLMVAMSISQAGRTNWRRLVGATVPGVIVIVGWQGFLRHVGASSHEDFDPVGLAILVRNAPRTGTMARVALGELCDFRHWSLLWPGFAVVGFLTAFRTRATLTAVLAVVMPVLVYFSLFWFSSWSSYVDHILRAFPRLAIHVAPLAWAIVMSQACSLRDLRASS